MLFFSSIVYWIIRKIIKNILFLQLVVLGVLAIACAFVQNIEKSVLFVQVLPVALFFYVVGNLISENCVRFFEEKDKKTYIIGGVCIPVVIIISQINEPVLMYCNQYGSLFAFVICALGGAWIVVVISSLLRKSKFLRFCGKNSVTLYIFHWSVVQSVRCVFNIINRVLPISGDVLGYVVFIISLPLVSVIALVVTKYYPWLLGENAK